MDPKSSDARYNAILVRHRDCHVIDKQLLSSNISLFNKFVGGIGAADLWDVRRRTRLQNINVDPCNHKDIVDRNGRPY